MTTATIGQPHLLQKLVMKKWLWLLFCGFFFAYPIYRAFNRTLPPEQEVISKVESFKFTSDQQEVFGSEQLKGRVYIANFFCLECEGSDELLKSLQKIQKRVKGLTTAVAIVSFTTQPEQDTVPELFEKGRELHSNPFVWKFLTSDMTNDQARSFITRNFDMDSSDNFSKKFALVDDLGRVRGYYNNEKVQIDQMMIDLGLIINRRKLKFSQNQKDKKGAL